jgi:hypothetical protein
MKVEEKVYLCVGGFYLKILDAEHHCGAFIICGALSYWIFPSLVRNKKSSG